jgi:serine acetyltransferase
MAVTEEATEMTAVTTAEIQGLISIFSAATMTEAAMCRLIVIADLSVVLRRTPAEAATVVGIAAAVISDKPHNSLDKNRPD